MHRVSVLLMAGGQGFEPQLRDSESRVLPIKLSPIGCTTKDRIAQNRAVGKFQTLRGCLCSPCPKPEMGGDDSTVGRDKKGVVLGLGAVIRACQRITSRFGASHCPDEVAD